MSAERMRAIDAARAEVVTAACAWRDDPTKQRLSTPIADLAAAVDRLRAIDSRAAE